MFVFLFGVVGSLICLREVIANEAVNPFLRFVEFFFLVGVFFAFEVSQQLRNYVNALANARQWRLVADACWSFIFAIFLSLGQILDP